MKIIPKFASGSMFTIYDPLEAPTSKSTSKSSTSKSTSKSSNDKSTSKSSSGELTEKDFFSMLKDIDGLPNEMNQVISSLTKQFKLSNLTGIDTGDLSSKYLSSLYQIKVIAQNKKSYDDAISSAKKAGALGEAAITSNGKLVVQSLKDGSVQEMSIQEYLNNTDNVGLLTNSALANLRAYDPKLRGNQAIIDIISDGMGLEKFQSLLSSITSSLTESKYSEKGIGGKEALNGLKTLSNLSEEQKKQYIQSALDGIYEYEASSSTNIKQINSLINYIVSVVPERAKTFAALKSGNPDTKEATRQLVGQWLGGQLKEDSSYGVSYKGTVDQVTGKNKSSNSSSAEKDNTESKETFLTSLQNGIGGRYGRVSLNLGNNSNFNVSGTIYGGILTYDGKPLSNVSLDELLTQSGIIGISNTDSIYFGNQKINRNALSKIAIENNGGVRAILPCVFENGGVRPDYDKMEKFSELVTQTITEAGPNATIEEREKILADKISQIPELQELLSATGRLDPTKFQPFFIVKGLASDINFEFDKKNPYIQRTTDDNDIEFFQTVTKQDDFDNNWMDFLFTKNDKLYKSSVFIPLQSNNSLSAQLFSDQNIDRDEALQLETQYQQYQKLNNSKSNMLF